MEMLSHGLKGVGSIVYNAKVWFLGLLMLKRVHPQTYITT
jgi:hypothetical protein